VQKNREKEKKERELVIQKQRREQRKREREAKEAEERLQRQKSLKEAAAQNANDDRYIYIKFIVVQSYLLGGATCYPDPVYLATPGVLRGFTEKKCQQNVKIF
jgi:hypothetical protein